MGNIYVDETLGSTVFAEGFKDWSGSEKTAGNNLLVTWRAPIDSGGVNFQLLLKMLTMLPEMNFYNLMGIDFWKL